MGLENRMPDKSKYPPSNQTKNSKPNRKYHHYRNTNYYPFKDKGKYLNNHLDSAYQNNED
jgi:hypothetical protein